MGKDELRVREVDRVAVQQLINREYDSLAGVILRLAWQMGLTRLEIHMLKWNQFSANFSNVVVDGRVIPVEPEVGLFFESLSDVAIAEEVVVSPVTKAPISEQYISMLATKELRSIGLDDIKLSDLRSDYVLRQMERYPLDYVAQVSNLQYFTLQTVYLPFLQAHQQKQAISAEGSLTITEEQIETIIEQENGSTIGLILDLVWSTEIPVVAVAPLTWRQVNLKAGYIAVDGDTYSISNRLKRQLQAHRKAASPSENVFLSARTRKPIDSAYIARMARELFVSKGLYGITLAQLQAIRRKERKMDNVDKVLPVVLNLIKENGRIQRGNVAEALNVDEQTAHRWLIELERKGHLRRHGSRYYLDEDSHWSQGYPEKILEYISQHPNCTRVEIEAGLGAPHRSAQPYLSQFVRIGKAYRDGRKYRKD